MAQDGILIVQDDFIEAERLRLMLAHAGYNVVGIAGRTAGIACRSSGREPSTR